MKKPNLFIVGAPKCGTTSMHYYLGQHPDVFMSGSKEPCYFASDFVSELYPKSEEAYLRMIGDWNAEFYIGEATSTYLYSKTAASEIHDYCPEAKIIIMLRNPVDMIYSLHAQRVYEGLESIRLFPKALEAEELRKKNPSYKAPKQHPVSYLFYRDIADYAPQIERYLNVFSPDQIHFIIFDDLIADPQKEVQSLFDFLDVKRRAVDLTIKRKGIKWKAPLIRKTINLSVVKRLSGILDSSLKECLMHRLTKSVEKMDPKLRRNLLFEFRPKTDAVDQLLGTNLVSRWCE